jgi:hypothetical protein
MMILCVIWYAITMNSWWHLWLFLKFEWHTLIKLLPIIVGWSANYGGSFFSSQCKFLLSVMHWHAIKSSMCQIYNCIKVVNLIFFLNCKKNPPTYVMSFWNPILWTNFVIAFLYKCNFVYHFYPQHLVGT